MISSNLRHLRFFLAVADTASQSSAAELCSVTQPAIAQALQKLEQAAGGPLFARKHGGFFLTPRGEAFQFRVNRALARLDEALVDFSARLVRVATWAQLNALIEVAEVRSFSEAARRLDLAQPTIHRAVRQLEREAGRALFERTAQGLVPTRDCTKLVRAMRLAQSELEQATADVADLEGREVGQIVVGALPLSRTFILPETVARFRKQRKRQTISIIEGTYDDLLNSLRLGTIDMIVGALRHDEPIEEVTQEPLFEDRLSVFTAPNREFGGSAQLDLADLVDCQWVVPRPGTPARVQFEAVFQDAGLEVPQSIVDCGSILLMRELLTRSDMLGCISERQAAAEIANGLLIRVPISTEWETRTIGLTTRQDWVPTRGQRLMLDLIRTVAKEG